MIDPNIFQQEFTAMCKWYGVAIDRDRATQWYVYLKEEFNDAEFISARHKVQKSEKFFPCPQDFIDYVKGGIEQRALVEWKTQYALCSIVGKKAWDSLPPDEGTISEVKYRRKQFLEAYSAFAKTATPDELAPTPPLPQLPVAKPLPVQLESIAPAPEQTHETGEQARERIRRMLAEKGLARN